MYHGDIRLGDTIDIKFTTRSFSTGAPTTLAGVPVISAYPGNSVTQLTAGITLTVDFDTVTGLHNVRVVATGANGYATATNYALVITTGTVGGVSVVGEVVGSFSIEARSALMPTTAARTLDVSAGGEAGVDWANVGTPGSTVGLSATTIGTLTTYTGNTPQTGDAFARLGAPAAASVSADILAIDNFVDGLEATIGVAGAGLTALGDARLANLDAAISTRSTVTTVQVNAEVVDALNVDTYAEPGQGTPAATTTLVAKIGYLFKAWRNRTTQTAAQYSLYNDDAVTVDHKATFSDDATTADRGEVATGP